MNYKRHKLKKVLITGALGQDGIILSQIFLKKKFKVYGFIENTKNFKISKVRYIVNNLSSKKKIIHHLEIVKPEIIIHLASKNETYEKRNKLKNYKINYFKNLNNTKNLLSSIIKSKQKIKLIFAGSSLMFDQKIKKVSEKTELKSTDPYGKYKIDSHNEIMKMKKIHKLDATTAILFNHDSKFRNKKFLIPRITKAFIKKDFKFIRKIYNLNINGDFSHAEDICKGIYKLCVTKKNIDLIILSSGKRFYINLIINYLEKYFKYKIKKKKLNKKIVYKTIGINKVAKDLIKYKPKKYFSITFKEILKFYL